MGTAKRYCVDCGSRLVYYANLSNPKAPNEYRMLTYACMNCTKNIEKPFLITIIRNKSEEPITTVKIMLNEASTKTKPL